MEIEGDGGSRIGRDLPPSFLVYVLSSHARGHMGIPETDGRKLGLSAGLGSWYEWGEWSVREGGEVGCPEGKTTTGIL